MTTSGPSLSAVKEVFDRLGLPGTPLTTAEVATELDCPTRTIGDRLETLVGDGHLKTKSVGENSRIWWQPATSQPSSPGAPLSINDGNPSAMTFHADGEMVERIREFEWAETPLGPVFDWPPELGVAVDVMLGTEEPLAIYWGTDFTLLYNDAWRELIGEKHPDALGQPAKQVFPELWDIIAPKFETVLRGEGAVVERERLMPLVRSGDLEDAWFDYSFNPIPIAEGSIGGILNIATEVTDRRKATRALRDSEERLELATEVGEVGIWELDLRTLESPARTRQHDVIFGYDEPVEDWTFERFLEHVVPEHRDRVERSFREGFETGVWSFECQINRGDGERRWITARGRFFNDERGEPERALGVIRDITGRKRREDQLERQREQFERQNERLEEFASVVSHDLRSPLAVVSGRLELFRETGETEHLDATEEAVERAERLVTDLLTVARHGRLVETAEPTDLGAVFERAREGTLPTNAAWEYEPVARILADRDRLLQLFENVLRNSVEYAGPEVTVRVGPLSDGAGFYIEDDGPGFAAVDPDRVFEFGYSGRESGTGFGLSIVRSIADAHGWDISIESDGGGGARFEIRGVEFVTES